MFCLDLSICHTNCCLCSRWNVRWTLVWKVWHKQIHKLHLPSPLFFLAFKWNYKTKMWHYQIPEKILTTEFIMVCQVRRLNVKTISGNMTYCVVLYGKPKLETVSLLLLFSHKSIFGVEKKIYFNIKQFHN